MTHVNYIAAIRLTNGSALNSAYDKCLEPRLYPSFRRPICGDSAMSDFMSGRYPLPSP